jgi:hypothetical protein
LHIRFSSDYLITKYVFFDIRVRIALGEGVVTNGSDDLQIDVSSLQPGYYMLKVVCTRNNEVVYPVFKVLIY